MQRETKKMHVSNVFFGLMYLGYEMLDVLFTSKWD